MSEKIENHLESLSDDQLLVYSLVVGLICKEIKVGQNQLSLTDEMLNRYGLNLHEHNLKNTFECLMFLHDLRVCTISDFLNVPKNPQENHQDLLYKLVGHTRSKVGLHLTINSEKLSRLYRMVTHAIGRIVVANNFPRFDEDDGKMYAGPNNKQVMHKGLAQNRLVAAFWKAYPDSIGKEDCQILYAEDMYEQVHRLKKKLRKHHFLLDIKPVGKSKYRLVKL